VKTLVLAWTCLLLGIPCSAAGTYSGGSGDPNEPYIIEDANDMQEIGLHEEDWDKHFVLTADIDLSAFDGMDGRPKFNTIGTGYPECNMIMECWIVGTPFTGTFNGNGFSISNFIYDDTGVANNFYMGLFGFVDGTNARIENVVLINPQVDVTSGDGIGPLVGFLANGVVDRCSVHSGSVSAGYRIGGLNNIS